MEKTIFPPGKLDNIEFVVIFAKYRDKWVYSWHKRRQSFEHPGGHVEAGETALQAARRELFEESGITDCEMIPLWDYEQPWDDGIRKNNGRVYAAIAHSLGELPESEMGRIELFDTVPDNYTYDREEALRDLVRAQAILDARMTVKHFGGEETVMTYAVRYYTKTGNTKRLAEAIAKELGVEALPISEPVNEAVDYLFLGNSYYAFTIDPEVKAFVAALDKAKVGKIVNFGSAAMLNSTYKKVKKVADKVGIPMDEKEFHCRGQFKGIHKGRPNEEDIAAAVEFAKQYK